MMKPNTYKVIVVTADPQESTHSSRFALSVPPDSFPERIEPTVVTIRLLAVNLPRG